MAANNNTNLNDIILQWLGRQFDAGKAQCRYTYRVHRHLVEAWELQVDVATVERCLHHLAEAGQVQRLRGRNGWAWRYNH